MKANCESLISNDEAVHKIQLNFAYHEDLKQWRDDPFPALQPLINCTLSLVQTQ